MAVAIRTLIGAILALAGLGALGFAVHSVLGHEYIAAILGGLTGLGLSGSGVELLRPMVGE